MSKYYHLPIVFLVLLLLAACDQAQNNNEEQVFSEDVKQVTLNYGKGFNSSLLSPHCPADVKKSIEIISGQMGLTDLMYSEIQTGIDSIGIFFGSFNQKGSAGYWAAMTFTKELVHWSTQQLVYVDTLAFPANNIDIYFFNSTRRISLRVMHNPYTNLIFYQWLEGEKFADSMHIVDIELPIEVGKPFPELTVSLLDGNDLRIADLRGTYTVINYWHSGCGPCITAIPGLNKMAEKYSKHDDVVFLAISMDSPARLDNFLNNQQFDFLHSMGSASVSALFGLSVPKYVIIDPDGIVRYYDTGGTEDIYIEVDRRLQDLLGFV